MHTGFKPQKGEDIKNLKEPVRWPKLMSPKYDGIRAMVIDNVPRTKSLKTVPNHFTNLRLSGADFDGLDGELIMGSPVDALVYNKTNSAVMSHEGQPDLTFYVFDDFTDPLLPFHERQRRLQLRVRQLSVASVIWAPQWLVNSQEEFDTQYQALLDMGYEGAMLREPNSTYHFGKSTAKSQNCLKCKPHIDAEAEILEVVEAMENRNESFINEAGHTDRSSRQENLVPKGMAGSFKSRDLVTGVVFGASAGKMTHAERVDAWSRREELKGSIFTYTKLGVGEKDKPRHGRWIRWRDKRDMDAA
jgi:DNA ligase-1